MKKFLLTASVAAMAVSTPAQAEREGRGQRGERAEQSEQRPERARQQRAERQQARPERMERAQMQRAERPQRAERQRARPERMDRAQMQRAERQASPQRAERQRPRPERMDRAQMQRAERQASPQRAERAARQQAQERRALRRQDVSNRRAMQQQAQSERRSRVEQAQSDRRSRMQQAQSDRRAQRQQIQSDRQSRMQQVQPDRRSRIDQVQSDRRSRIDQAQSDRRSRFQQIQSDQRSAIQQARSDRRSRLQQIQSDRRAAFSGDDRQWRQQNWERRSERLRAMADRRGKFNERQRAFVGFGDNDDDDRRSFFRVGQRVDRNWWYDDYVPYRYRLNYDDDDRYYYRYDGDYLYRLGRNDNVVLSLFPVLGGAYSVGRHMPFYQTSYYNVPLGYSSLYYDRPDSYYRYGDGAIYGVDPTTQLITGIVALLTGQSLRIGQALPMGYDVYNVPYAYRSSYYDTPDMWYRYDDGHIYGVDPRTRMIEASYPVYGGYMVGNEWPSYAGYGDYDVPDYYDELYYDAPGYDYRYASGGIYQVDPKTQLISALAALVTGQNFNVGQRLPLGYDTYNVPFAYRDDYYDDGDNWYRYADGRILQVDPGTRVIRRVILV